MSQLPPDPARLRVILAWLDDQITDNATLNTYLKVQHHAVTQALARAEGEQQPAQPPPASPATPPRMTTLPTFTGDRGGGFKVVERAGSDLVSLHVGDCDLDDGPARSVDAHEAVAVLRDGMAACVFCRPDLELGYEWIDRGWFLITSSAVDGDTVTVNAEGLLTLIDEAKLASARPSSESPGHRAGRA
ncbi:DUF6233 domain-containing protein [Streptomyces sp. NPDC001982]|uniref:DUF6233 domain-containing protein n=1 Tax=Streptomyces sp. NPDC001982 TaxID=3154405 RepID=UPI00331DF8F9